MEGVEDWGLDEDQGFSEALLDLVPIMERTSRQAMLDKLDEMLQVMAYMSSSRAMRLMEWFDENYQQGLSINLVEKARSQPNDPRYQILLDRLRALQSLTLLGRVFSPARTRLIADLLREATDSRDPVEGRGRF